MAPGSIEIVRTKQRRQQTVNAIASSCNARLVSLRLLQVRLIGGAEEYFNPKPHPTATRIKAPNAAIIGDRCTDKSALIIPRGDFNSLRPNFFLSWTSSCVVDSRGVSMDA